MPPPAPGAWSSAHLPVRKPIMGSLRHHDARDAVWAARADLWIGEEMDVVLVRHGVHDVSGQLTPRGEHQVESLADALRDRGSMPDLILHSGKPDAARTARMLGAILAPSARLLEIPALTPRGGPGDLSKLADQARRLDADLASSSCVLAVGPGPAEQSGHRSDRAPFVSGAARRRGLRPGAGHAGAIRRARAGLLPVPDGGLPGGSAPRQGQLEDDRRRPASGLVLTALTALLVLQARPHFWGSLAVVALSVSLALFLASVYFYDQLSTPSGFWTDADQPRRPWQRLYERREARLEAIWTRELDQAQCDDGCEGANEQDNCRRQRADDHPAIYLQLHDGRVYWLMVSTSRRVFTPAVFLAVTGFIALLIGTGNPWIWACGLAGLAAAALYAALHRPELGAD
jgi:hypothetical protein